MHEWALAEGVVLTALKAAEQKKASRVLKITVKLGELQQMDESIFKLALKELSRGTKAEGSKIELVWNEARFKCNRCGREWKLKEAKLGSEESEMVHFIPDVVHVYSRCPGCESPDFSIEEGRGVWIDSVEVGDHGGS
jgi:hydrogenase nickel incorporation protein HypA/HybF